MSSQSKAQIIAVDGVTVSNPDDFPVPLEGVITVKLDTGRVVEMVIGELSMLYEAGEIPNELTPIAAKLLFHPAKDDDREREKRYWERWKVVKWLVGYVMRKPKFNAAHLYHGEIWQIYNMANDPALALENFRLQQAGDVGFVSDVQDLAAST